MNVTFMSLAEAMAGWLASLQVLAPSVALPNLDTGYINV
jgi:hypothetical protein